MIEELNEGQNKCLDSVTECINSGSSLSIRGQAGTGKSFLTKRIVERLEYVNKPYALCGLTHKSAAVLAEMSDRPTCTVHSCLRLVPKMDRSTGKQVLRRGRGTPPPMDALLVIDESSLMGNQLDKSSNLYQRINIGDPYQLAPVGEPISKALFLKKSYQLTEVMRHDSDILALATDLCDCVKTGSALPSLPAYGEVEVLDKPAFDNAYFDALEENSKEVVSLSWTNKACINTIRRARREVFGLHPDIPIVGDIMTVNAALVKNGEVILPNNADVQIIAVEEKTHQVNRNDIRGYSATVAFGSVRVTVGVATDLNARDGLIRGAFDTARKARGQLAAQAWHDYEEITGFFADLRFPYAVTTTKAQGSGWGTVFVDTPDILRCSNPELVARHLYVACSRAQKRLVLRA